MKKLIEEERRGGAEIPKWVNLAKTILKRVSELIGGKVRDNNELGGVFFIY